MIAHYDRLIRRPGQQGSPRTLVPIAALEKSVRAAAAIYAKWSRKSDRDSWLCFDAYHLLVNDNERRAYLDARLADIRQAHAAELLERVPPYNAKGETDE